MLRPAPTSRDAAWSNPHISTKSSPAPVLIWSVFGTTGFPLNWGFRMDPVGGVSGGDDVALGVVVGEVRDAVVAVAA